MRRLLLALALLVLCSATAAVPPGAAPAAAQAAGDTSSLPRRTVATMSLESFPAVLQPGEEEVALQVRVANPTAQELAGLAVTADVHRRTWSRFDYQQAMDDGEVGASRSRQREQTPPLPPGAGRTVRLTRSRAQMGLPEGVAAGVYPMRVALEVGGEPVQDVITSIVVTDTEQGAPLRTTFLLPLDAPPTILPPGGTEELAYDSSAVQAAVGRDGRLRGLLSAAQAPGTFPVTVASSPRLLQELADVAGTDPAAAAFLTDLRELVGRGPVQHIALPHGPADLVAMVRGGLETEAIRHLSIAPEMAERLLGDAPLPGVVWPPDGLDERTMGRAVTPTAGDMVVLGEEELAVSAGRELPVTPSPVRHLRTGSGARATALVPDPWLTPVLARPGDRSPAVEAQRIVAETAALYFERPFAQTFRGVLLTPPQLWDPPSGFAAALLAGLEAAPWLKAVGPERLRATVSPERQPVRLSYPDSARQRELPATLIAELDQARRSLGALATLLPAGDPVPGRFDRRLLTASSVHYRPAGKRAEARALVGSVQQFAGPLFDAVSVNDGLQLILPSAEGTIPVSISNGSTVPLQVRVSLGEAARRNLEFAGTPVEQVVLEPGGTTTLPFRAQVRTPGATFPIDVVVTDLAGSRVLATGRLVVRSTATSPVALAVTIGALLFLLTWWLQAARRRRHELDEPAPAPVPEPVRR